MTNAIYEATVPASVRILNNLSAILKKAEAYATDKKIEPSVLLAARLAPDMFPLTRQVQIATDSIKGAAARLAQVEVPSFADTETTFAEIQERIAKTVTFLKSIKPESMDGAATRAINLKVGGQELNFTGNNYLFSFAIPNFYFHVTSAYAILRHNGLAIGKMDYLGDLPQAA